MKLRFILPYCDWKCTSVWIYIRVCIFRVYSVVGHCGLLWIKIKIHWHIREQWWCNGESTFLPPMWFRFVSWTCAVIMCGLRLVWEVVLRLFWFSSLPQNQHFQISKILGGAFWALRRQSRTIPSLLMFRGDLHHLQCLTLKWLVERTEKRTSEQSTQP